MSKRLTTQEFIQRAQAVHNDKYIYSLVEYITNHTKVKIICPKHGEFLQSPRDHLAGSKCKKCNYKILSSAQEFIQKAQEIHQNKYDYSLVEYKNNSTPVKIICPIHGKFEQSSTSHLNANGCYECYSSDISKSNTKEFIQKAQEIHQNKYDYFLVEYKNVRNKVKIICPKHGEFLQTPRCHLQNRGCAKCGKEKSNYERYKNKKTTLYYIFLPEFNLYKIGLTQSTVKYRYRNEIKNGLKIEILESKEFQDGYEAYLLEQNILNNFRDFRAPEEIAQSAIKVGWTELFTINVLEKY